MCSMTTTQEAQDTSTITVEEELAVVFLLLEKAAEDPDTFPLNYMAATARQGLSGAAVAVLNRPELATEEDAPWIESMEHTITIISNR